MQRILNSFCKTQKPKPGKWLLLWVMCFALLPAFTHKGETYQCMPCGSSCDKTVFDKPGTCSECHMELVKTTSIVFQNIAPDSVCDYLATHPKTILLDVRTPEEFEGKGEPNFGTLNNAINIPVQELQKRINELKPYQKQTIIVYCSHSHRSPRASYILTQNGFSNTINMLGGMSVLKVATCKK